MQILAFIAMICWLYTTYKLLETKRYITAGLDIIALGIIVNAIIDRASFGPLTSILFAIAIMMGTFELCFGIPLLVDAGIDANYEIKNVLRKQSIKF